MHAGRTLHTCAHMLMQAEHMQAEHWSTHTHNVKMNLTKENCAIGKSKRTTASEGKAVSLSFPNSSGCNASHYCRNHRTQGPCWDAITEHQLCTDTCRIHDELINPKERLKGMGKGNLRVGRKVGNSRIPSVDLREPAEKNINMLTMRSKLNPRNVKRR